MIDPKDEEWLKRILKDCFENESDSARIGKNLTGFRIIIGAFVKNIEKNVNEMQVLWEKQPGTRELREKFHLLKKNLFYFRRYCEPR